MALEHILSALEEAVAAEIAEIRAEAEKESARTREEAAHQVQAVRKASLDTIQPRVQAEQEKRISRARLEAQRHLLDARRHAIQRVFEAARGQLARARERDDYPVILAALTGEVLAELTLPARLRIDPRDLDLLKEIVEGHQDHITLDADLQTWGGLIGHSGDGRISVDNTLEARLEQVQARHWGEVAALMEQEDLRVG